MSPSLTPRQHVRLACAYLVAAPLLWLAFNYSFLLDDASVPPLLITPLLVVGVCALFCWIRRQVTVFDGLTFLALVAVTSIMALWPDVYLARLWQSESASRFVYLVTRIVAGIGAALMLFYFWSGARARGAGEQVR